MRAAHARGQVLEVTDETGNVRSISFRWPIAQVIEAHGVFVVRTEPPPGSCDDENIFGVAGDARVRWQVPRVPHVYEDSPYTGMTVGDDGLIRAHNWDGLTLVLDPATGREMRRYESR